VLASASKAKLAIVSNITLMKWMIAEGYQEPER